MKPAWSILLFLSIYLPSFGQDYYRWISFAEEAKSEQDYYGAVRYYEEAFALDSTEQDLNYALAEAYESAGYYQKALRLFLKVYSKGRGRFFPEGPQHIAQLKMYQGEYETAIEFWKRALRRAEDDKQKNLIKQRMKSCSYALSNPLPIDTLEIIAFDDNINSTESEMGGTWKGDSLFFFSSLREEYDEQFELANDSAKARIYLSTVDKYGFSHAKPLYVANTNRLSHFAYPHYDSKSNTLYHAIHRAEYSYLAHGEYNGDTLISFALSTGDYAKVQHFSQPFVFYHQGLKFILFSAKDSESGSDSDIWIARLQGKEMQDPTKLSGKLNTPGNEVTPYYESSTSELYFSSDWHPGYGGYDIFSASFDPLSMKVGPVSNLGLPTNSTLNDHSYARSPTGYVLTSNRYGSLSADSPHCCNDLYAVKTIESSLDSITDSNLIPEAIEQVSDLNRILPISLYFHNDIPDPGSQSNRTEVSYEKTLADYVGLQQKYESEYAEGLSDSAATMAEIKMRRFFEERVIGEHQRLESVMYLLEKELGKGVRIEIAIKGFASPLAQSDYNRKLTERRISSLINYLKEVGDGMLRRYMNGEKPELSIRQIPYGEEQSESYVSDNPRDKQSSIYSVAAARERRVEILRIQEQ